MTLDRTKAPLVHDAIEFDYKLPSIHKEALDNGLRLYWLNAGVQDVVEVDWVFPAGLWQEQKAGVAQAVAGLLKNGTSKRTANQLNEALEYYGASLRVRPGNDSATLSLFTLTKHLPDLLPIVFEIITEATFPQEELNLYKQNVVQRLLVNLRQCDFVANQKIDALLFGENHPYGRFSKRESIEALTREDLIHFYDKCLNLFDVKIFMAGNVGKKEVALINNIFGQHNITHDEAAGNVFSVETHADKKHNFINDENGVQGAIRIGSMFPNRKHEDYAPLVLLNTVFGGYFGSRLMSNIREDKGFTYGIYSGMTPMRNAGTMVIQTEVGRKVIEDAINEVYKEMDKVTNDKVADDELLLVKNYLLGSLLGDLDGPFQILQRWRMLIANDMDIEDFDKNVQIYKSTDADTLRDLAQKYYNKENFHEVVVV